MTPIEVLKMLKSKIDKAEFYKSNYVLQTNDVEAISQALRIHDVSARTWCVEISQNGWEYTGYANIICKECKKIDDKKVVADGIEIEFDEEINEPYVR